MRNELLAAAAVVLLACGVNNTTPASTQAKPVAAPQPTQAQVTNQNSANFAKDSLPVFLPSWSMPAYMAIKKPAQNPPQQ